MTESGYTQFERRRESLVRELTQAAASNTPVGLSKSTSNLFRHRDQQSKRRIDVRDFHHVLSVDSEARVADVEGMTTYEQLADETLKLELLPAVVPQLKTITIGGAVSGLGVESSSFRFGLVHETVEEMEILLGNGSTVICSPSQNQDLFYGFPNSYGTLGYVLRLKAKLIPAKRFVRLRHGGFRDCDKAFAALQSISLDPTVDYLDAVVFSREEAYITTGEFTDEAPYASDYTYRNIYYQSIRFRQEDYLTAPDYIWRWDTDWFWCSKHFYVQNPMLRMLATRKFLNSRTYQRIMRTAHVLKSGSSTESVIQDVDIPIEHAPEFLDFLLSEIGILPIWLCPFRSYDSNVTFPLCGLEGQKLYINFGFWDVLPRTAQEGFHNRKIENKAMELKGKKGLYSTAYYDRETFWKIYDRGAYLALKKKYDPTSRFRDLYEKTVLKM